MVILEFPELAGPPAEFIRAAQLSLLEHEEKSNIEETRLKLENKDHHKHRHPHGAWHKHARDHKHGYEHGHKLKHGHKDSHDHGFKHELKHDPKHGHKHKSMNGPECEPNYGHNLEPPNEIECEPKPEPNYGPMNEPKFKPRHGPKFKDHLPIHGPRHGTPKGQPPPYVKDPHAPKDKGHFVLAIIGLFGLVHMMPIMFFFTANEYWMYKFRNTTSNSTDANDRTYFQTNFASLTKLTITAPGVVCNFIAALVGHKIKAETRVFSVLFIHSSVLIAQAIFANINTDDWQSLFFGLTLGWQMVMSCAMSLGGSGSMGLISKLPPRYMKAQLIGEGMSGLFSALLRLVSIFCAPTVVGAALMYFVTGSVLMVGTSIIFYFATQTKFFKYHTRSSKEERKEKIRNVGDFKDCLKILWPIMLLNIFPMIVPIGSIIPLVVSEYYGTDNVWGTKYFVTVCTYIIPAFTGLIGRGLFSYTDFDCSIPILYILVISREALFGVLIFLSNAKPRHNLPVLLNHDWQYALMMAGNSLTSGFIMTLNMLKSMRMVPKNRIELSMMCNMFFMSIIAAATSPLGVLAVNLL